MCEKSVLVLVSNPRMPVSIVGLMPLIAINKAQLHELPDSPLNPKGLTSHRGSPVFPLPK
jgi:hypothetical protein